LLVSAPMTNTRRLFRTLLAFTTVIAITCATAGRADAGPQEDFSFELKEMTKEQHRAWVIDKFMTFKLGKACWAKVVDKKQRALHMATHATKGIADYAKEKTGNDWSRIEGQSANTREENRKLVEKMMDELRPSLKITISVEGDDCDAGGNSLWLKYMNETIRALQATPPKSGKAFITINVTAKAKGVTVDVGKDGSTFTITGARDVEEVAWDSQIQKAFKRVSSKN
jgi:hypothetical protein